MRLGLTLAVYAVARTTLLNGSGHRGAWMDLEQDLRTISDELLQTLEQLQRLEGEKRAESPGSPRFLKLAREVEKLAAMALAQTSTQQSLSEEAYAATQTGTEIAPIDEVVADRDVSIILGEWRDAERRHASTAMDTADHSKAAADVRRLRDEYQRAHKAQSGEPS